jgi:hypothetical protein
VPLAPMLERAPEAAAAVSVTASVVVTTAVGLAGAPGLAVYLSWLYEARVTSGMRRVEKLARNKSSPHKGRRNRRCQRG